MGTFVTSNYNDVEDNQSPIKWPERPVQIETDPTTGQTVIVGPDGKPISLRVRSKRLVSVAIGNSIAVQAQEDMVGLGRFLTNGEMEVANALSGSVMIYPRISATTRADRNGIYGYSGATLSTILTDLQAQLFSPLNAATVSPDLIVGLALVENDIASGAGRTFQEIRKDIDTYLRTLSVFYPTARHILCTPRPSFSYDTEAKKMVYTQVRDYLLSLDNGSSILTARLDGYEHPEITGTPLPGYTDASVHPNARGTLVNARRIAATLRRLASAVFDTKPGISGNPALTGSVAASGTNTTGTMPTGAGAGGSANGTYVHTAENPGWKIEITANAKAGGVEPPVDLGGHELGSTALAAGVAKLEIFAEVEIVSGAENLRWIELQSRLTDGTSQDFWYHVIATTGMAEPDWRDGDKLTLTRPWVAARTGDFSLARPYIKTTPKLSGGRYSIRVLSQGVRPVV